MNDVVSLTHRPVPEPTDSSRPDLSLPADLTSFEGRREEVADIKRLMRDFRLVTLTGVGGVGKTRLAIRLGGELSRQFPDGIGWVELADLRDGALLAQAIEDRLSIPQKVGRDPLTVLVNHLQGRQMLLILDNCEHLLDSSARLVDELLRAAPGLRVMATSRQALGVPGERLVAVEPLPVPPDGPLEPGMATSNPAMALFGERAAAFSPGFAITPENQAAVADLCRKLEGIPLAIELASVKVRVLSVRELVDRLDDRFQLLSRSGRSGPSRHQTIQATIDWSYELCTDDEKLLWARASIFAGGFEMDAAEDVCSDARLTRASILNAVEGLVDKSILGRVDLDGRIRFRLLEPLREHGHTELCRLVEETSIREKHLAWCGELIDQACMQWFGPAQERWCITLRLEHANFRAAVEYALNRPDCARQALKLVGDPWFLWIALFLDEGRQWLERALENSPEPSHERAKALATAGYVAALQGDREAAEGFVEESSLLATDLGDAAVLAYATHVRGLSALFYDPDRAVELMGDALPLYQATDVYDDYVVVLKIQLGLALVFRGELDRAAELFDHCQELCALTGERWLLSYALYGVGFVRKLRGRPKDAVEPLEEAVRAKRFFQDALGLAVCLDLLAWVKSDDGEADSAAMLLGAASRVWDSFGVRLFGSEHWLAMRDQAVERSRTALGDRVYAATFAAGEEMPRDQILKIVLREKAASATMVRVDSVALTPREQEVADLVAEGLSNRAIAERLVVSRRTAEGHVENILAKFGFNSRAQIASWVSERRTVGNALQTP